MTTSSDLPPLAPAAATPPLGRWQYSLRSLMLFVLFAAMGTSLVVTGVRYRQDEAELARFRREYGIFRVDDPTMLYAAAQWSPEPHCWRWRVHLPAGRYDIACATQGIPWSGIPQGQHGGICGLAGDADITVVAGVCIDPVKSTPKWKIEEAGTAMFVDMPANGLGTSGAMGSGILWGTKPATGRPDEPLVLLRYQLPKKDGSGTPSIASSESHDGLLLWIRPAAEPSGAIQASGK